MGELRVGRFSGFCSWMGRFDDRRTARGWGNSDAIITW